MNKLLQRVVAPFIRTKGEGDARPGPWYLPITGGWLPADVGDSWNWWQNGYNPLYGFDRSAIVEACLAAYSQTIAMCPGDHWRANKKGGRTRVTNSAASRILRFPNDYETASNFMLNLTRCLYSEGNAYALALRNDRYEVDELHLMNPNLCLPMLATTGDIFYQLQGNDVIARRLGTDQKLYVPMRDVLHVRLNTNRRNPVPLIGQSPIMAAMDDIGVGMAIAKQQMAFYMNEARPSAVLSTDLILDKEQVAQLRDRWNEQAKGLKQGGTPILTAGLKVQPWAMGGKDAAIADIAKMSKENIALVYRVPLAILGLGNTTFASTELLMQAWIATGLGFALNHVEESFDQLFNMDGQPDEYVEFSTEPLLRSQFKDRIETMAKAVVGGIFSPNEARNAEGLDNVPFGDEPRVQQQVVPLSQVGETPPAPAPNAPPAPPSAPPQPQPQAKPKPPAPKGNSDEFNREVRRLFAATERVARRRISS